MKGKRLLVVILVLGISAMLAGCEFSDRVNNNDMSKKYFDGVLNYKKHPTKFKDVPNDLKDDMKDTTTQFNNGNN